MTCIHAAVGLCPECQDEYDEDPDAYIEFGNHPAGLARWKAELELQARWNADVEAERERLRSLPQPTEPDSEIPF